MNLDLELHGTVYGVKLKVAFRVFGSHLWRPDQTLQTGGIMHYGAAFSPLSVWINTLPLLKYRGLVDSNYISDTMEVEVNPNEDTEWYVYNYHLAANTYIYSCFPVRLELSHLAFSG